MPAQKTCIIVDIVDVLIMQYNINYTLCIAANAVETNASKQAAVVALPANLIFCAWKAPEM